MGTGPDGSGVTISKPDPNAPRETYAERQLRERVERRRRLEAHQEEQREFLAAQGAKMQPAGHYEDKALPGPPENKAPANPSEGESAEDLDKLSKAALRALAEDRNVTVTRGDGRTDLEPTKTDYVGALS